MCGRSLTDEESRKRGIGPICAAARAWEMKSWKKIQKRHKGGPVKFTYSLKQLADLRKRRKRKSKSKLPWRTLSGAELAEAKERILNAKNKIQTHKNATASSSP